jgi:hypothetical protein
MLARQFALNPELRGTLASPIHDSSFGGLVIEKEERRNIHTW